MVPRAGFAVETIPPCGLAPIIDVALLDEASEERRRALPGGAGAVPVALEGRRSGALLLLLLPETAPPATGRRVAAEPVVEDNDEEEAGPEPSGRRAAPGRVGPPAVRDPIGPAPEGPAVEGRRGPCDGAGPVEGRRGFLPVAAEPTAGWSGLEVVSTVVVTESREGGVGFPCLVGAAVAGDDECSCSSAANGSAPGPSVGSVAAPFVWTVCSTSLSLRADSSTLALVKSCASTG